MRQRVPLWTLLRVREEYGRPDLPLLTVVSDFGVRVRDMEAGGRAEAADPDAYKVVHVDDLVVNRLWARFGAYGVSAADGIISPAYWVLEPDSSRVTPRFLHSLLRSSRYLSEIARRSKDMPPNGFDLPWNQFRHIEVELPPLKEQRVVADFLDAETTRIDALIEKKQRMVDLIQARLDAMIEDGVRRLLNECGGTPLKYGARRVEVGIVVTPSAWYGEENGIPALRGLNVRAGAIDLADLVYLTKEGHELHRKSMLRRGDVVIVRTGQAGAAAVVPPELDGCNCIDLVIVRPNMDLVPQFLELVLNSDWTQKHVEEFSVGTIQSHFNVGAMKQVPIPLPPVERQLQVAEELMAKRSIASEAITSLSRQINLLHEHRQALITAAVTGGLAIPELAA